MGEPTIELVSITENFKEVIFRAWWDSRLPCRHPHWGLSVAEIKRRLEEAPTIIENIRRHGGTEKDLDDARTNGILLDHKHLDRTFVDAMKVDAPISSQITLHWAVKNVSRAFMDQLDRYQVGIAFWEQSLRMAALDRLYDEQLYFVPPEIKNPKTEKAKKLRQYYDESFRIMQERYNGLIERGMPPEHARGVVGLHINTGGSFAVQFRQWKYIVSRRACYQAQSSYWMPIINQSLAELRKVFPDELVDAMIVLPCKGKDKCPLDADIRQRLIPGNPDVNPMCPIYWNRYMTEEERAKALPMMLDRVEDYPDHCQNYIKSILGDKGISW